MARQMYERYLTAKSKMPEWMDDIDTQDPKIGRAVDEAYALVSVSCSFCISYLALLIHQLEFGSLFPGLN